MNNIPITTGVIGHRDAVLTAAHKQVVQDIFGQLVKKYPNSPVVLFSQLAKGVDTAVAQWFLELKDRHGYDFRLIVPLPYDKAYYEKTQFGTADELATFRHLLTRSERYFELNRLSDNAKRQLHQNPNANTGELNTYYRDGGEFVADNATLLIAIWDEKDNGATGGTAETVFYRKTGSYRIHITPHIFDKDGPLISIPCVRRGQTGTWPGKDYTGEILADDTIRKTLQKIEEINTEGQKIPPEAIRKKAKGLFPHTDAIADQEKFLRNSYAIIDIQAIASQKTYFFILKSLFVIGFVTYVFFEIYKHLGLHTGIFFITLSLIGFAIGLYRLPLGQRSHRKYIENRVLAEALRIQFFWHLAGIRETVANHILRLHRREYEWIRYLINGIYGISYRTDAPPAVEPAIQEHWIRNQKNFFSSRINKYKKMVSRLKRWEAGTFILGVILLVILFLAHRSKAYHHLVEWLIVADSIVFGVFGLIKAYYEKRSYEQLIHQYNLMFDIYHSADAKLNELKQRASGRKYARLFKAIVKLAGKEALIENGNWYMVYKDKKPEIEGLG